jgi:serine/threonine protein kinase
MPLSPGTHLGSYEIIALIGAGGMGEVYRARDVKLQREVAIKVLSASFAQAPDALDRFEREALSVARLSHPNILAIFGFAHDGPRAYVVTELVDGETLRARLEQKQPLATMMHLCGAGAAAEYVRRGLALTVGQRCGTHDARGYVARVTGMQRRFRTLASD